MQEVKKYPNNVFSWVDLATTDLSAAKAFYGGLFGWDALDIPIDEEGNVYVMFQIDGKNVAGGGQLDPATAEQGVPPNWTSYVNQEDVDAVAARITEAGGNVMMSPMDVFDSGRMAIGTDPTGAVFGVWQPKNHIGAQLVNQPGTLVWNELQTRDTESAQKFYGHVFGWTGDVDESGYVTVLADGRRHAGMIPMDENWEGVPPNWSVYFHVEDVEASAAKAQELGGKLLVPVTPAGEIGRFAVVQDPQGAVFNIIEFKGPADPPPGY